MYVQTLIFIRLSINRQQLFQLSLPLKLLPSDDQLLEVVGVHRVVIVLVEELLQVLDQHLQPGVLPP